MKEVLLTSTVLIAALLLLRFCFRKTISRRVQYALWALVLLRLLLPLSLPALPVSVLNFGQSTQNAVAGSMARPIYVLPVDRVPASQVPAAEQIRPGELVPTGDSFGYPVLSQDGQTVTKYAEKLTVAEVLTGIWLAGAALMTCLFLVTNLRFWQKLRKDRTPYPAGACKYPVYLCHSLPSPCLFGLLRPAIYLNPAAAASPERLRYVLAHEETHARQLDP
ncbi:MAG: M56 family metallopeptidase, partial [Pseudoflavonifractor sp.]